RRICLAVAALAENSRRSAQVDSATGAASLRAGHSRRPTEDGLRRSSRLLATRSATRLGRGAAHRTPAARCFARAGADPGTMGGASLRTTKLAISALGRVGVPGVEG